MEQKIRDEAQARIEEIVELGLPPTYVAKRLLSLSGEIDEVCEFCQGQKRIKAVGMVGKDGRVSCPICNGTGTIKKKWEYKLVVDGKII